MSQLGLGCAKTKSDLVVAEDKFLRFFALRMTTEPKISRAVIPRRVFTQPRSKRESALFGLMSAFTGCEPAGARRLILDVLNAHAGQLPQCD